ncbi:O-acetylhomoserine (thiol)-lyase [Phlyctema vagabunda]|uniref:O-acetylhomoserine (Thiol)-lyase n=1 Tax=Phlyctema vagabunda TaxID=108571 RepID=A0ABR4P1S5_9HELO
MESSTTSNGHGIVARKTPLGNNYFDTHKVNKEDAGLRFDTLQVHAGHKPDSHTHSRAVPIYATASYVFTDSEHAKRVCTTTEAGYVYSRVANPTVEVFEKRAACLEGGTAAVASASGQAAIFNTIICLAGAGDNIVASINLYGGTYSLFKTLLPRLGITVKWAKKETVEEFSKYIDDNTKMIFVESIGNPRCSIPDLRGLANVAHENGIPFVVDNTFGACGIFCRPKEHGADIIIHSATKWMGGHGTTIGGVTIDCGTFDWGKSAARFPQFTKEDGPLSYSYWKVFGNVAFAIALRINISMEVGSILSPFAAQQLLIGMETLSLRCERHATNTMAVARFLQKHPRVAWINYPGLEDNEFHENAKKYLQNGYGGVLSFGPKGGDVTSKLFINSFKIISQMTNVGDSKTMATHPWNSTHVIMSEANRREAGISPEFIRFSVGTEDIRDIIGDLSQALDNIPAELLLECNGLATGISSIADENSSLLHDDLQTKESRHTQAYSHGIVLHSNATVNGYGIKQPDGAEFQESSNPGLGSEEMTVYPIRIKEEPTSMPASRENTEGNW